MTRVLRLPDDFPADLAEPQARSPWCCRQLEEGNILFFPITPLELSSEDVQFLLGQRQSDASYHKNIAYRPLTDRLSGYPEHDAAQLARLRKVMRAYSQSAIRFVSELLAPYGRHWRVDFTSYRPQQEKGRPVRLHARNDLLHVDSFPSRSSNGDRILRIFTNINPREPRVWITAETFEGLINLHAGKAGFPKPQSLTPLRRTALRFTQRLGLRSLARPPYDRWMLRFHHFLKEQEQFQRTTPRSRWEFPPNSTWLVFTDMVSHAVLSGQFALEQTFMISKDVMVEPEKAPIRVLERLAGGPLSLN